MIQATVLMFSQEVDHIWNRRWSFMTALYFIARYSGSLSIIGLAVMYLRINWTYSVILNIYLAVNWSETMFILTMQAILMVRVLALFNQRKKVVIFLATFYCLQATAVFVMAAISMNNRVLQEEFTSISPAIGSVTQNVNTNNSVALLVLAQDSTIVSVVFDSVMLLFALWAFVKHAFEAKTLLGKWSIDVLVRTLVTDQLVYFVCIQTCLSLSLATNYITESSSYVHLTDVLDVFGALIVVAGPRMVISLRAMENKTKGEGGTLEGELSTVRFGNRELHTQSESVMEEGGGFRLRAAAENV
ncbi:hypothetical protein BJ138DRAFT_392530 [Hygrophoropsis aurantiaca]|uniref:Uncharacterized protein n=1 Tax=Hygrophoropsis aurantiaca TaxID=72124 RepID=A0ACB8A5Z9_9AGAM|nr:hypothetical protein BJ138DRAFT_392530 [Hygrophoropsis aurantiaca]